MALSQLFWDVLMPWNLKSTYFSLKIINFSQFKHLICHLCCILNKILKFETSTSLHSVFIHNLYSVPTFLESGLYKQYIEATHLQEIFRDAPKSMLGMFQMLQQTFTEPSENNSTFIINTQQWYMHTHTHIYLKRLLCADCFIYYFLIFGAYAE